MCMESVDLASARTGVVVKCKTPFCERVEGWAGDVASKEESFQGVV
jgi:hypothetical protein